MNAPQTAITYIRHPYLPDWIIQEYSPSEFVPVYVGLFISHALPPTCKTWADAVDFINALERRWADI